MPNYCNYSMKVVGKETKVDEFIKIIQSDYHFDDNGKCNVDRHMWRVFEADVTDECIVDDIKSVIICGYCAWSVYSCMFDGPNTYQGDHCSPTDGGTTLQIESARLGLDIEVFSEETGCCFMEHYLIRNGVIEIDDCVDFYEYCTDNYETVEEMNEELATNITQEEFDYANNYCDGYVHSGGMEWDFTI